MLNSYARYQKGLTLDDVFPSRNGVVCACGCGRELSPRQRKWASPKCRTWAFHQFAIIKGDNKIIRKELFKRDQGFCHSCGVYHHKWEADHIIAVSEGGSACDLSNFQTLCPDCHKAKTYSSISFQSNTISLQAASRVCQRRVKEAGHSEKLPLKAS